MRSEPPARRQLKLDANLFLGVSVCYLGLMWEPNLNGADAFGGC